MDGAKHRAVPALRGRHAAIHRTKRHHIDELRVLAVDCVAQQMRANHNIDMQEHTVQHDDNAESVRPLAAGGGRLRGALVRAASQSRMQPGLAVLLVLAVHTVVHDTRPPDPAVPQPVRERTCVREVDENISHQLAGQLGVLELSRGRVGRTVRAGEQHGRRRDVGHQEPAPSDQSRRQ